MNSGSVESRGSACAGAPAFAGAPTFVPTHAPVPTSALAGALTLADASVADLKEMARLARAWAALAAVEDPEIPALSIVDLGLIRSVAARSDGTLDVGLSPTYVGCPATEVIRRAVEQALLTAGVGDFAVTSVLSPAWTSDWISAEGRCKLEIHGIVPPERATASLRDILRKGGPVGCPRCRSTDTECISEFGSTPCKALHRCRACLEPFEYFKCI